MICAEFKCLMRGCYEHFEVETATLEEAYAVERCAHCGTRGGTSDLELLKTTEYPDA